MAFNFQKGAIVRYINLLINVIMALIKVFKKDKVEYDEHTTMVETSDDDTDRFTDGFL